MKPSCFSVLTPNVEPYCVELRTLADNVIGAAPVVGVYAGSVNEPVAGTVSAPAFEYVIVFAPPTAVPSM